MYKEKLENKLTFLKRTENEGDIHKDWKTGRNKKNKQDSWLKRETKLRNKQ